MPAAPETTTAMCQAIEAHRKSALAAFDRAAEHLDDIRARLRFVVGDVEPLGQAIFDFGMTAAAGGHDFQAMLGLAADLRRLSQAERTPLTDPVDFAGKLDGLANRITDFLDGKGRSLATVLYSAEERATMKAFASVMKTITPARMAGGSASPNSDTAPMLIRAMESLQQHQGKINMLLAGLGFAKGGPAGAAAAYGVAKGAGEAAKAMAARRALKSAQEAASGAPATHLAIPVERPLTGLLNPTDRLLLQGMD